MSDFKLEKIKQKKVRCPTSNKVKEYFKNLSEYLPMELSYSDILIPAF